MVNVTQWRVEITPTLRERRPAFRANAGQFDQVPRRLGGRRGRCYRTPLQVTSVSPRTSITPSLLTSANERYLPRGTLTSDGLNGGEPGVAVVRIAGGRTSRQHVGVKRPLTRLRQQAFRYCNARPPVPKRKTTAISTTDGKTARTKKAPRPSTWGEDPPKPDRGRPGILL